MRGSLIGHCDLPYFSKQTLNTLTDFDLTAPTKTTLYFRSANVDFFDRASSHWIFKAHVSIRLSSKLSYDLWHVIVLYHCIVKVGWIATVHKIDNRWQLVNKYEYILNCFIFTVLLFLPSFLLNAALKWLNWKGKNVLKLIKSANK